MPCSWLSLDAMDASGDAHLEIDHDVFKQRLTGGGKPIDQGSKHDFAATKGGEMPADGAVNAGPGGNATCGSCYGAETPERPCCNSCDDVRAAYQQKGWVLGKTTDVAQCK